MELSAGTCATGPRGAAPERSAAVVVVPARDEEERIGACLDSLAMQEGLAISRNTRWSSSSTPASTAPGRQVEAAAERWPSLRLRSVTPDPAEAPAPPAPSGWTSPARGWSRSAPGTGCSRAPTPTPVVARDWLRRQLEAIEVGAEAVGGEISPRPRRSRRRCRPRSWSRRSAELVERARWPARRGPSEHAHFSGASLGITPRAYRRVGGMGRLAALEDQELEDRLAAAGVAIHRPRSVRVTTAARTDGRAERGLAGDLELGRWLATRRFSADRLRARPTSSPRRTPRSPRSFRPANALRRSAPTVEALAPLRRARPPRPAGRRRRRLGRRDRGDRRRRRRRGPRRELRSAPELGPCRGKGDAMWRAARRCRRDVLVFLDADSPDFRRRFRHRTARPAAPRVRDRSRQGLLRAAALARRLGAATAKVGRVTELVARPLLNLHFPALAGFAQPLAGEVAIRREPASHACRCRSATGSRSRC